MEIREGGSLALEIRVGGGGGNSDPGNPGGRGGSKNLAIRRGDVWIFSGITKCHIPR